MPTFTASDVDLAPIKWVEFKALTLWSALFAFAACSFALAGESPKTLCSDKPSLDEIIRSDYCDGLNSMHEPTIPAASHPNSKEVYRFLWFRSFHPAVIVRIDVAPDMTGTLTLHSDRTIVLQRELTSQQTKQPINSVTALTRQQVAALRKLIRHDRFWNSPSQFHLNMEFGPFATPIPKGQEILVSDGAQWVIEGQSGDRYHVIGDEGGFPGPVWDIGLAMLHLAQRANPLWLMGPVY